jgi:hypothetical protein
MTPGASSQVRDHERVALLVLASQCPRVLEALAHEFDSDRFRLFVHVDRKVDIDAYCAGRSWPQNLVFLDDRHEVFWGGFSMVRATETLARRALACSDNAVMALVSDDTLPLVHPDRIHAELCARPDRIDVGLSRRNPPFLRRYTDWYFLDSGATTARAVDVGQRRFDEGALDAVTRMARLRSRGKYPLPEVWGGSQWWSLGRDVLASILDELSGNLWLRESFEFAAVPDEQAIQTLYALRRGLTSRSFTSPMFADLSGQPAPAVFGEDATIPACPDGKLFIRKVADGAADAAMSQIRARWDTFR